MIWYIYIYIFVYIYIYIREREREREGMYQDFGPFLGYGGLM